MYKSLRSGELVGRKHGKRTLILNEDLHCWLKALPKIEPKPSLKKKPRSGGLDRAEVIAKPPLAKEI